ncbi:aldo/keto reductase family protein [Schleiferilactobacillus shenzhenensis]|uniref:Prostaglandin F synthase n=1 Tax=Schleiferilactobacillus shenzhenensis LY-73 TaxID=1231336 RepID=U4TNR8_9LACO|nr:aldo/keto reductase [Schleiferilactobacillus shenzhenensis]ERL65839.1 Prostaglandin F synthase [Schleiferilactobacillus shenzhenensis LY-73]
MATLTDTYTLTNGVQIPKIGFGTWQVAPGQETYDAVTAALKLGYRHIDTAYAYRNEADVGRAIRDSGLKREDVFVTTKLPAEIKDYDRALDTFNETMAHLDLGYVDLYLIHAPWPWGKRGEDYTEGNLADWRAFEEIYNTGRARAIGISNFAVKDMQAVLDHAQVAPMVNQIHWSIGYTEPEITKFAQDHGMLVEAYSPLGTGRLIGNKDIQAVADHYGVSTAQVAIRYAIQKQVLPLPRSINPDHIKANQDIDGFTINAEDMQTLDALHLR